MQDQGGGGRPAAADGGAVSGKLDLTLPPPLAALVREAARTFGGTPRLLALEALEKMFGEGLLAAVLDRG